MLEYFAWFGTISLIMLTYQDFKNNRKIDDRRNFFMFGVAATIPAILGLSFLPVLINIVVIFVLRHYVIKILSKFKGLLGGGDVSTIFWLIMGFSWLGWFIMSTWFIALFFFTLVYFGVKRIMKITQPTPFMIVLLCSFVLTCLAFGLY